MIPSRPESVLFVLFILVSVCFDWVTSSQQAFEAESDSYRQVTNQPPQSEPQQSKRALQVIVDGWVDSSLCWGLLDQSDVDDDGRVDQDEFVDFAKALVGGVLPESLVEYEDLPQAYMAAFTATACLCSNPMAGGDSGADGCCDGENAHIRVTTPPSQSPNSTEINYLYTACSLTAGAADIVQKSPPPLNPPTDAPTEEPTGPTASPSESPNRGASREIESYTLSPGVIAGISLAALFVALLSLLTIGYCSKETLRSANDGDTAQSNSEQAPQERRNEIMVDPFVEDISTIGGLSDTNLVEGGKNGEDDSTTSVNLGYDYDRCSGSLMDSSGTAFTSLSSKLSQIGNSVFAADMSFEQQYTNEDEEEHLDSDQSKRPKLIEVRVPPGMVGMIIDTPNGAVPVVRSIKPYSFLTGRVQIGDRLIAVDRQDVTSMKALEVSHLISTKSDKQRLLVFVRLGH